MSLAREGNTPVTGEFPHKGPVTRKMFPLDDVILTELKQQSDRPNNRHLGDTVK